MDTPTKHIQIGFAIPADLDTPSETLAEMKQLLLQGARNMLHAHEAGLVRMREERVELCRALLTES